MEVIIYTSDMCDLCKKLKKFLTAHDIAFDERDVTEPQNAEDLFARSGQEGVPVTVIGSEVIVGFEPEKIRKELGLENE